ncbi:hypothetical protein BGE01nite_44020 [Brevifollis gellanilyticus]|uniref:DUF11 domain-containing protein n=2 Tax=Brevifollis gellanilyticus TaxID=748831 RepID=A0A512MFI6_9BACT|nr:hypothetical protein BGE01nite_44020 [Brevifollis gellanilyticus]
MLMALTSVAQAGHWVAGRDMVANEAAGPVNPNGAVPEWSYGDRATAASTDLELFGPTERAANGTVKSWNTSDHSLVGVNTGSVPAGYLGPRPIYPGEMVLHPRYDLWFTVVRWTAPRAGTYAIAAYWQDHDWGGGDGGTAHTVINGEEVFAYTFDNGNGAADARVLTLAEGDTVDFLLGTRAGNDYDATRFNAFVTTVDDPAALWVGGRDLATNEKPDGNANELLNPNGTVPQWTYGYRTTIADTALGVFTNASAQHTNGGASDDVMEGWKAGDAAVTCNTHATTGHIYDFGFGPNLPIGPREMLISPTAGGTLPVVRWTAPATGRYEAMPYWQDIDGHGGNGFSAHVVVNGVEVFSETMNDAGGCSTVKTLDLTAGDQVDFLMGTRGEFSFDTTKFDVFIVRAAVLPAPASLAIETASPPMTEDFWTFATHYEGATEGLALRVQYADATTPDQWHDLDAGGGTNAMTDDGEGEWSLFIPFLDIPAGYYRFRVVAAAPGYGDSPGQAFGVQALGESGTDPIGITAPGAPPLPPTPQAMPASSKVTYVIGTKASATTAKQGQVAKFTITMAVPSGTPTPEMVMQWSATPADPLSWQNLDDQTAVYSKTAKNWTVTAPVLPVGTAIHFRTLTKGQGRVSTPGPVISSVLKTIGPIAITPGPIWKFASLKVSSPSDTTGKTAVTGEIITYKLKFENAGTGPATDVLVSLPVPAGTELIGGTSADLATVVTSANRLTIKKLTWAFPTLAPGGTMEKEIRVQVKDTTTGKVTMPAASMELKSDELPPDNLFTLSGNPNVLPKKDVVTNIFSALSLTLTSSASPYEPPTSAGVLSAGQAVFYTLKAKNRSTATITSAVVTLRIPDGMSLEYVALQDPVTFDFTGSHVSDSTTNPAVTPVAYGKQRTITWNVGSVLATQERTIKFALRVMYDLESFRIENGTYVTNTISVNDYNITGKTGTKVLKAFYDAASVVPVTFSLSDYPYLVRAPNLSLTKTAFADGQAFGSLTPVVDRLPNGQPNPALLNTTLPGVGSVAAPHKGTRITYTLKWANKLYPQPQTPPDTRLPAMARNVTIREEIPANTTFVGFMRLNDTPLASAAGFTFLTKEGHVIPSGGEPFTDTNGNGFKDAKETAYTDTNGNKRYDAFTDTRFFEYKVALLSAGAGGKLTYDVIATGTEGSPIVSRADGAIIPKPVGGVTYQGYAIWCENRRFGGTATPEKLTSIISRPLQINQPVITAGTNTDLHPGLGQRFKLEIGYDVRGLSAVPLQDYLLTVTVPKPFTVVADAAVPAPRIGMVNTALPVGSSLRALRAYLPDQTSPTFRRGESAPIYKVTATETTIVFKLGNLRGGQTGAVGLELQMPSTLPTTSYDKEGFLKIKSYAVKAEMSHAKVGTTVITPASGLVVIEPTIVAPRAQAITSSQLIQNTTRLFLGRIHPLSVRPNEAFDMIVFFGNATGTMVQGGLITMAIPPGITLDSQTPVVYYYTGDTPAQDNLYERNDVAKVTGSTFTIETLDMAPHTMAAVSLHFIVAGGIQGNTIEDGSLSVTSQNSAERTAIRMCMGIQRPNFFTDIFNSVLGPIFNGLSEAVAKLLRPANEHLIKGSSRYLSVVGADIVQLSNGSVIIPLQGRRVAAIGGLDYVHALDGNILMSDDAYRVTVSHESASNVSITGINTNYASNQTWNPHSVLKGLALNNAANLVAAGGGNLVAAGGGNLVGMDGSTLVGNDGASLGVVSFKGPTLVAAGGGNLVAAGGGNLVAAGGGNLVGNDGSTLVGQDGGSLLGLDGSFFKLATTNLVAAGGGNLVAAGGGNLVAAGGGNLVAAGGMNLTAPAVSGLISNSASSILAGQIAGAGIIQNLSRAQIISTSSSAGILSHNGGQVLSHNGGVLLAP